MLYQTVCRPSTDLSWLIQFGVSEVFGRYHQDQTQMASAAWSDVCLVCCVHYIIASSMPIIVIFFDWQELFIVSSWPRIYSAKVQAIVRIDMLEQLEYSSVSGAASVFNCDSRSSADRTASYNGSKRRLPYSFALNVLRPPLRTWLYSHMRASADGHDYNNVIHHIWCRVRL